MGRVRVVFLIFPVPGGPGQVPRRSKVERETKNRETLPPFGVICIPGVGFLSFFHVSLVHVDWHGPGWMMAPGVKLTWTAIFQKKYFCPLIRIYFLHALYPEGTITCKIGQWYPNGKDGVSGRVHLGDIRQQMKISRQWRFSITPNSEFLRKTPKLAYPMIYS